MTSLTSSLNTPESVWLNALQTEKQRRLTQDRLKYYRPYPKQKTFHSAGAKYRERLLMAGNLIAVVLAAINWYLRFASNDPATVVLSAGIWLSLVTVLLLLFNGWKGWELVYHHHVGVADVVASERESMTRATASARASNRVGRPGVT